MAKHQFSATHRSRVFSLFIIVALSASSFCGCSKSEEDIFSSVYGIVTDYETGEPLVNVSVVLSPTNVTKHTGADGTYRFDELDAQQYTVTFQKAGYQPNRKLVTAISGESLEVNMHLKKINQ